jgi:trk system potassium uptake protein TrkH
LSQQVILRILSRMCQFMAAVLLVPAAIGFAYGESDAPAYLATAAAALLVSGIVYLPSRGHRGPIERFSRREGFASVVLAWATMIAFGAIPYWITGSIPHLADSIFESASGFSTTGATILTDIEALSHAHLFHRSLSHWVGGMGIIVLSVAILPELSVGGMQLFSAEASGLSPEKLAPRIVSTARKLWQCYVGMTVALFALLLAGGMDLFDASTHAFGTIATGGFSTRNASIAAFDSLFIESVITFFMLASGISFALTYRLFIRRDPSPVLKSVEVRVYLAIFLTFTAAITASLFNSGAYESVGGALRVASFQTASIITTTGYGTADFNVWPDFCRYLLVLLMFLGGCAGSTAGGVKVVRLIIVAKHSSVELKKLLYPTLVHPVTLGRRAVSQATIQGILGFFLLYIGTTVVATTLVLATGVDLVTGVTAVISAMNSIGPGLNLVGPATNFAQLPDSSKLILSICMVVGRLEIYTIFVLFTQAFWRTRPAAN